MTFLPQTLCHDVGLYMTDDEREVLTLFRLYCPFVTIEGPILVSLIFRMLKDEIGGECYILPDWHIPCMGIHNDMAVVISVLRKANFEEIHPWVFSKKGINICVFELATFGSVITNIHRGYIYSHGSLDHHLSREKLVKEFHKKKPIEIFFHRVLADDLPKKSMIYRTIKAYEPDGWNFIHTCIHRNIIPVKFTGEYSSFKVEKCHPYVAPQFTNDLSLSQIVQKLIDRLDDFRCAKLLQDINQIRIELEMCGISTTKSVTL